MCRRVGSAVPAGAVGIGGVGARIGVPGLGHHAGLMISLGRALIATLLQVEVVLLAHGHDAGGGEHRVPEQPGVGEIPASARLRPEPPEDHPPSCFLVVCSYAAVLSVRDRHHPAPCPATTCTNRHRAAPTGTD